MSSISTAEARRKATSRKSIHTIMLRNQWHIPRYKDRITTREWMHAVRSGVYWAPKTNELNPRNCADMPSKEVVFTAFTQCLNRQNRNMGITNIKDALPEYMMSIISTLEPHHDFFKKSYVKPVKEKKVPAQ